MTAVAGTYSRYDQQSVREDLEDVIYDISPMDTFFFTNAGRTKVTNTRHDWQTDALDTPAINIQVEGDEFSAASIVPTVKLNNYCTISRKDFIVSDTARAVNTAGYKEEVAYQTVRKIKALKRDIETHALSTRYASAGTSALARCGAGVEAWLRLGAHVHPNQSAASTPAFTSGLPASAVVNGTATALTVGQLTTALQQAWSMGGETDTILVGPALKAVIDAFTGIATRFRNVAANSQADIVTAADIFVSDFGSHKVQLSRYVSSTTVLCMDMKMWSIGWLRPINVQDIAKTGDATKKMVVGEWVVIAKNPDSSTKLTSMT